VPPAPESGAIAVVAEKPSVARDIARVLGASRQGAGYLHGNGYVVTWWRCAGAAARLAPIASVETRDCLPARCAGPVWGRSAERSCLGADRPQRW